MLRYYTIVLVFSFFVFVIQLKYFNFWIVLV